MPAALSMSERRQLVAMREQGQSFQAIAEKLKRNYETVRKLYHRYVQRGQLEAAYDRCRHPGVRKNELIYQRAIQLKQAHPRWGAGLIWIELAEEFDETQLPSQRTLQRWFRRGAVQNPAPERRPRPFAVRGKQAHEVWAMDAKEQVKLADGSFVSWLTVTDEGSGAVLGAFLFPPQTLDEDRPAGGESSLAKPDAVLGTPRKDPHG